MEIRHRSAPDAETKPVARFFLFAAYPATWLASIATLIDVLLFINDTPIRAIEYVSKSLFFLSLFLLGCCAHYNVDHKVKYLLWPISIIATVVFFFMFTRMID